MLRVENVSKSYRSGGEEIEVLRGASFALSGGESLALTGESGSGKSTLLHIVGGLETADGGKVVLGDVDILALDEAGRADVRRRQVGVIFQQFNLIPSLTVRDNITFHARLSGGAHAFSLEPLSGALGLTDQLDKYPEDLSGGQQQRVAIARTLAMRPQLILADEPTGNLDEENAEAVLNVLLDLVRDTGTMLMMVTHSSKLAGRLDKRLNLSAGHLS